MEPFRRVLPQQIASEKIPAPLNDGRVLLNAVAAVGVQQQSNLTSCACKRPSQLYARRRMHVIIHIAMHQKQFSAKPVDKIAVCLAVIPVL